MRAIAIRQRTARTAAAAAAAILLLAACGTKPASSEPGSSEPAGSEPAGTAPVDPNFSAGMIAISNGTETVDVGGRKVTFPTTVTDAAWSPDGSRLAFIDKDGNVATARLDGSDLLVLTAAAKGVVRSRPAWSGAEVIFAEQNGKGKPKIMAVYANGIGAPYRDGDSVVVVRGEFDARAGTHYPEDGEEYTDEYEGNQAAPSPRGPDDTGIDLAFQRAGAKGPEVWIVDVNQRTPLQVKVADGSEPALTPDGSKVAFVNRSGQIVVAPATGKKPTFVQVTFGAKTPTHLVWSPDAKNIAFQTPTGVDSVAADVAAGATSNPAVQISASSGVPTYLRPQTGQLTRISGADAVATSIAASQARWRTREYSINAEGDYDARAAVITGTTNLPALLAGAQVVDQGPLLFTSGATLDPRTATELKRVLGKVDPRYPDNGPVVILGGTDVVSTQAENAIRAMGYRTDRIAAKDPAAMAVIAAGKPALARDVFVVDAADTAAYLAAISSLGYWSSQTVLVIDGSTVPAGVKTFINQLSGGAKVYAVGAAAQTAMRSSWTGKPSKLTVTDYVGATAAATPAVLFNNYGGGATKVVLVNSSSTTDVITGIGLARAYGAPVIGVNGKGSLDGEIATWLRKSSTSIDEVLIVDSSGAVSSEFQSKVVGLVSGPLGCETIENPKAGSAAYMPQY